MIKGNVLSKIPGQYIVGAMSQLPLCGPDSTFQQLDVDAAIWGRFRITYTPFKQSLRGWDPRWFWIAKRAEPLEADKPVN